MAKVKRSQKFVDTKVQGTIMLRTMVYWAFCMMAFTVVMLIWRVITQPAQPLASHIAGMWFENAPVAIASLLLLPILLIDAISLTNRFAGPALRLRRAMRQLADGETVEPVRFRKRDFWHEFCEDFNRVIARVETSSDSRHSTQCKSTRGEPNQPLSVRG